ncbi:MAG TPA: alpha/beta fold hydrolase [Candidatus Paceibacterota bacterium]|nr:alpha/beta fold hydrolase [Candidatus Paceibacterota bacterium]HMO83029.1 alpha/beta fold hydrolase [Candidatus Paceibacterota bacterium]
MKTSLHRIITKDNLELVGLLYEPEIKTDKVLAHVHGMGGNFYENKFLDVIAKTLTDNNTAFFVFNNRGCEAIKDLAKVVDSKRTFVRIGDAYEKFEDSILDIAAAIEVVANLGFEEIHLSGHSLGSPKVAYYLAETKDARVKSVLLLSPSDMLGLVRANPERFKEDLEEATKMVQAGKGGELLSRLVWDEYLLSAATYLSLFADDSKAAIFNFHNATDSLETLSKITQPMFATMGRKDDSLVVSIEETMERIANAAKNSQKVETKILGDANHGYIGSEEELSNTINLWIQKL